MRKLILSLTTLALIACGGGEHSHEGHDHDHAHTDGESGATQETYLHYDNEKHLANIRQLTWGGDNAEAYFSFDNSKLVFQSNFEDWGLQCDQIFYFNWNEDNLKENKPQLISTGKGRTTCSYFLPGRYYHPVRINPSRS